MLSSFGNFLIVLVIALSIYIINLSFTCLKNSHSHLPKLIFKISLYQSTFSIICFLTLIQDLLFLTFH